MNIGVTMRNALCYLGPFSIF